MLLHLFNWRGGQNVPEICDLAEWLPSFKLLSLAAALGRKDSLAMQTLCWFLSFNLICCWMTSRGWTGQWFGRTARLCNGRAWGCISYKAGQVKVKFGVCLPFRLLIGQTIDCNPLRSKSTPQISALFSVDWSSLVQGPQCFVCVTGFFEKG